MLAPDRIEAWIDALIDRHTRDLSTPEFLKAIRALSARYVERRTELSRRSPTDSAGRRAAFSAFYAPLHFLTTRAVVLAVGAEADHLEAITDVGCGTGVASAAWASTLPHPPALVGVDRASWALDDAKWNWHALGFSGRTRRMDLARDMPPGVAAPDHRGSRTSGVIFGWSVNELDEQTRRMLLPQLLALPASGTSVLVLEPLAREATPWWDAWTDAWIPAGGRSDDWKFAADLPPRLAELSEAAGFRREFLGARALWLPRRRPEKARATIL